MCNFEFWRWKAEVILRILEHPAMQPDAEPPTVPDFDGPGWKDRWCSGMTVEEAFEETDACFNKWGW